MKNSIRTRLLFVFLLLSDFVLFAQPGDSDNTNTLEGEEAPAAPIDSHLIWLGILGMLYILYFFYSRRKALTEQ